VGSQPSGAAGDVAFVRPSTNNLSVNPQFVDPDNGDFHLSAGSPLIGISTLLEGVDLEGNPHPTSGKQDLGAYTTTVFVNGFESN